MDQPKQANTNDKPRKTKAPLEAVSPVTVINTGLTDHQIPLEVSNHVVQNIPVILSSRPPSINNRVQHNLNFNNIIKVDIDKTAISTHNEDVYVSKLLLTNMMRRIRAPNDEKQVTSQCHSSFVSVLSHNQELKYPIPSIMKPRKSKRPECIRVPNYNSLIPLRRTVTFSHFPKICFSNVRSMVNKIDEIFASISTNLYDVVVITEIWLNSRITDELIRIPGYVSCRRNRPNDQSGGGLCTYRLD